MCANSFGARKDLWIGFGVYNNNRQILCLFELVPKELTLAAPSFDSKLSFESGGQSSGVAKATLALRCTLHQVRATIGLTNCCAPAILAAPWRGSSLTHRQTSYSWPKAYARASKQTRRVTKETDCLNLAGRASKSTV